MSARKIRANSRTSSRRPDKLQPLAEATGGTVRRIGKPARQRCLLAASCRDRESPVYGGAGYAAIKRIGASEVKGVSVMPLAIGFLGLAALLGSIMAAWVFEGRGGGVRSKPLGSME